VDGHQRILKKGKGPEREGKEYVSSKSKKKKKKKKKNKSKKNTKNKLRPLKGENGESVSAFGREFALVTYHNLNILGEEGKMKGHLWGTNRGSGL